MCKAITPITRAMIIPGALPSKPKLRNNRILNWSYGESNTGPPTKHP